MRFASLGTHIAFGNTVVCGWYIRAVRFLSDHPKRPWQWWIHCQGLFGQEDGKETTECAIQTTAVNDAGLSLLFCRLVTLFYADG